MTPHKPPHKYKFLTSRYIFPILLLLIFLGIATLLYALGPLRTPLDSLFTPNYAEQVAKPIEEALVGAGAVKKCSSGDNGIGGDVGAPRYQSVFATNLSEDQAEALVSKLASDGGFRFARVSSSYDYIRHYSGNMSLGDKYPRLESGTIELRLSIYSGGNKLGCFGGGAINSDGDHAAITLSLSLPPFRSDSR